MNREKLMTSLKKSLRLLPDKSYIKLYYRLRVGRKLNTNNPTTLNELLRKSSVLVLPSYNEGLPMAILEGMACGKAIISTTVGAIPEVVKKENGILVQPGDVTALANVTLAAMILLAIQSFL